MASETGSPERIYLWRGPQWTDGREDDLPWSAWPSDDPNGGSVEYVRADLVTPSPDAGREALEEQYKVLALTLELTEYGMLECLRAACRVAAHQTNGAIHPLTCGNKSSHQLLVPDIVNRQLKLRCRDCDWVQDVPSDMAAEVVNGLLMERTDEPEARAALAREGQDDAV